MQQTLCLPVTGDAPVAQATGKEMMRRALLVWRAKQSCCSTMYAQRNFNLHACDGQHGAAAKLYV